MKIICLLVIFLLLGCYRLAVARLHAVPRQTTQFSGNRMTLDYQITVADALTEERKIQIERIIDQTFDEIDAIYNKWNPHSEVSALNTLPRDVKVRLSPQMEGFLRSVSELVALTEGRFDPTILPLQNLWLKHLQKGSMPTHAEIAVAADSVGWHKIHFCDGIFHKDTDGVSLDFGAIAKGFCVDLLTERLTALGLQNLLVDWSGELRSFGQHPSGRPWQVAIQNLAGDSHLKPEGVALDGLAMATSGDYYQYWIVADGKAETTYFHIIHPHHHRPLIARPGSIGSASVRAQSCALADALATALMTCGTTDKAHVWMARLKQKIAPLDYWIIVREK